MLDFQFEFCSNNISLDRDIPCFRKPQHDALVLYAILNEHVETAKDKSMFFEIDIFLDLLL